jgi:large subunit ribosomal protein L21e
MSDTPDVVMVSKPCGREMLTADFLRRVKENAEKRRQAKETGATVHLKRQPVMPREARLVKPSEEGVETLHPIPYDTRI